jgi:hypothetical protein
VRLFLGDLSSSVSTSSEDAVSVLKSRDEHPMDPRIRAALEAVNDVAVTKAGRVSAVRHPGDFQSVVEILVNAWRAEVKIPFDELQHWALAKGWPSQDARDLTVMSQAVRVAMSIQNTQV